MADAPRFLGIDHDAIRSAAKIASPPRSSATSAARPDIRSHIDSRIAGQGSRADAAALPYPLTRQQLDAGRRGFAAAIAEATDVLTMAAEIYRASGQTSTARSLENLIPMIGERELDTALLDPRR